MNTPAQLTASVPLSTLLGMIWRRRWIALLVGAVVAALVFLATMSIVPLYEADAMLVVDKARKALQFQPDDVEIEKGSEFSVLNTQRDLLVSYPVLRTVLDETGLAERPIYKGSRDPIELLRARLKVLTNKDSWVITLAMRDEDPEMARTALAKLIATHLENEAKRGADRSRGAISFLREQVDKARATLVGKRAAEQEMRLKRGILSTDPDRNHLALDLATLSASRIELGATAAASAAVIQAIDDCAKLEPAARGEALLRIPEIHHDPLVGQRQEALFTLQDRVAALEQRYKPGHPLMIEATKQVDAAKERLAEVTESSRASLVQNDQALRRRLAELDQRIAANETGLASYRSNLIELQDRTEEAASAERLFQTLLGRLQEEEVTSHLGEQVVSVAEPAHGTQWPVNIRKSLFMLAALFLGVLAGGAAALVVDGMDGRIRDAAGVREATDLPTLGFIPHYDGLPVLGRLTATPNPQLRVVDESFRILRSTIQLSHDLQQGSRIIAIASPSPSDGRTVIATRLARSLTASGRRVLLIDGDMRNPTVHSHLGEEDGPGLCELLVGEDVRPIPTSYARLDLLRSGAQLENIAELFQSVRFYDLLSDFTATYHYIVIDTPPLEFSESLMLGAVADDILLVVRERSTTKEALRLAHIHLGRLLGKVLGLIINDDRSVAAGRGHDARLARPAPAVAHRPLERVGAGAPPAAG